MSYRQHYSFLDDPMPAEADHWRFPKIYSSSIAQEGFNAIKISLNGRLDSSLDWREQQEIARKAIDAGLNIFWDLDLGLFQSLSASIFEQTQYLSLGLGIKHFRDSIWNAFRDHSLGVSIYNGDLDFKPQLKKDPMLTANWNDWLERHNQPQVALEDDDTHRSLIFACNAAIEYIDQLASRMPGELPVCVCFDARTIADPFLLALLLSKERYERLYRAVANPVLPLESLTLKTYAILSDHINEPVVTSPKIGICLPLSIYWLDQDMTLLQQALQRSLAEQTPVRIISEAALSTEWDGLDELIVCEKLLSPQGLRKVRGFCAAGGKLRSL